MEPNRGEIRVWAWFAAAISVIIGIVVVDRIYQAGKPYGPLSGTANETVANTGDVLVMLAPDASTILLAIVIIIIGLSGQFRD